MAICDANYKFLYIDVGCEGRISDGGVFNKCSFAAALENEALQLPHQRTLSGREEAVPYVIVADDAFSLKQNIMKPFPGTCLSPSQRIFNYRLSRARRVIENAFGIMTAKFRVLRSPIHVDAAKTRKITLACCALHNFLITRKSAAYMTQGTLDRFGKQGEQIDGSWRKDLSKDSMYPLQNNRNSSYATNDAKKIREEFEAYFASIAGEVPWQYKYI